MPTYLLPENCDTLTTLPFHPRVVPSRQPLIETRVFPTSLYLASLGQNLAQRPGVNVFSQDTFALNSKYEYNLQVGLVQHRLCGRSQRRSYNWTGFNQLLEHYRIERPRIVEGGLVSMKGVVS